MQRPLRNRGDYFGRTTLHQRRLMIQVYEQTGNIRLACRQASVSPGTFYRWWPRYREAGDAGLKVPAVPADRVPRLRIATAITSRVIELKRRHPDWGKKRIACILREQQCPVSPNTVRKVLAQAGLI